eukprot:5787012-Pyramimonas_sp.AAC.2
MAGIHNTTLSQSTEHCASAHPRMGVPSSVPSRFGADMCARLRIQTYARMLQRLTSHTHVCMAGIQNTTVLRSTEHYASAHPRMGVPISVPSRFVRGGYVRARLCIQTYARM